jgi:hypothetical protein
MKSGKAKQNGKKELRRSRKSKKSSNQGKNSKSALPLTLSMQALPLRWSFIIFLLSSTLLANSSTNFLSILSPFGNEPIKHKPREERDAMHENQN